MATTEPLLSQDANRNVIRHVCFVGLIVSLWVLILLIDLGDPPVQLWDEARPALHALEMAFPSSDRPDFERWTIQYYGNAPESLHQKPPMMTWLSAVFARLLGVTEFALRLPSALAALGTSLILFYFGYYQLRSPVAGLVAAAVLLTTPGYVAEHVALTADYDALLVLFMTAYLFAAFIVIDANEERRRKWIVIFWVALLCAALTKGVQAFIPLPAIALYAALRRSLLNLIRTPMVWVGFGCFSVFVATYYGFRELFQPGYLEDVLYWQVVGRYLEGFVGAGEGRPVGYYFMQLALWQAQPWLYLVAPAAAASLAAGSGRFRHASHYLLIVLATYLLVISFSATKFPWYLAPAFPILSSVVGMGFASAAEKFKARTSLAAAVVLAIPSLLAIGRTGQWYSRPVAPWTVGSRHLVAEGAFLRDLLNQQEETLRSETVEFISQGYNGALEFYAALAIHRELRVAIRSQPSLESYLTASCDSELMRTVTSNEIVVLAEKLDSSGETYCALWSSSLSSD